MIYAEGHNDNWLLVHTPGLLDIHGATTARGPYWPCMASTTRSPKSASRTFAAN